VSKARLIDPTEQIAPGVFGYTVDTDHGLYIPWIMAGTEGNGDVGRYLMACHATSESSSRPSSRADSPRC